MAALTEEDYLRIYQGTGLTRCELEKLLKAVGTSKRNTAMSIIEKIKRKLIKR